MQPGQLSANILQKKSFLCVGLDSDIRKIPSHLLNSQDPVYEFNARIIEATADLAIAYKPNLAFYESLGPKGWETLKKTLELIPENIFTIADAKRGDIGNTSGMYARAFFEELGFDAITVAPYMGRDSVLPFLEYENHWVFLLALTSNAGAEDFQYHEMNGEPLYKKVISISGEWAREAKGNLGYVVGATRTEQMAEARALSPDSFFLVPGVGAQGGSLEGTLRAAGKNVIVNSSREILYASQGLDFAEKAREKAKEMVEKMNPFF